MIKWKTVERMIFSIIFFNKFEVKGFYLKASYSIFCTLAASGSEIYGQFKFQNRGISCSLRKIFLLKFSTLKDF